MTERSLVLGGSTSKPRNIDLYVAGYPCPSFSALGRKRGGLDPRGVVTLYGSQWIIKEQPKACILENVAGLLHVKLSNPCLAVCKDPGFPRGPYTQPANATPGVLTRNLAGLAVRKQL